MYLFQFTKNPKAIVFGKGKDLGVKAPLKIDRHTIEILDMWRGFYITGGEQVSFSAQPDLALFVDLQNVF